LNTYQIAVKHADVNKVAQTLNQYFQQRQQNLRASGYTNEAPSDLAITILSDTTAGQLIVNCNEKNKKLIDTLLKTMDVPSVTEEALEVKVFSLEYAHPSYVAQAITNTFRQSGGETESEQVRVSTENYTMSLIVSANKEKMKKIEELVHKLDKDSGGGRVTEIVEVKNTRASSLANTVNQILATSRGRTLRGQLPASVVADDSSNTLAINAGEKEIEDIKALIQKLDVAHDVGEALQTKVFSLEYAHPSYVAQVINNNFRQSANAPESEQVRVSTENYTMSLVVSASPEKMKEVEELVQKLDKDTGKKQLTEVIPVENARASSLGQTLNRILSATRGRTLRGQLPASVVPDDATNTLAVTANEKDLEDIKALIKKLDVAPDEGKERLTRPYTLEYADYSSVSRAISDAFANQRSASIEDQVTVSAIWSTNTVVVTASEENHKKVADIIESIDTESSKKAQREVIVLQHADATQLARTLNQTYYSEQRQRRGGQTMSITAAQDSNSLIVSAGPEDLKGIKALTKELDTKPAEESERIVKPYALENADAYAVSSVIARSYSKRGSRVEADQVDAVAERYTNTVVVTATPDKHEKIAAMIKDLDKETEDKLVQEVIQLEHADARQLASSLNRTYYYVQRNRRGGQPISIMGNTDTNSLIISAGQKDLEGIKKTVSLLDKAPEEGDRVVKPYALENADVYSVAQVISRSFSKRGSQVESDQVDAVAERMTNTVVVTATPEKHEKIAAMIKDLDEESTNVSEEHVIKLEHADASELARALTQTYRASRRGRRGGQITVNAESSSNSLIVAASEADLKGVQAMVAELDKPATEDMEEIRIIPLQFMDAAEAEEIMSEYLQKPGGRRRRGSGNLVGNIKLSSSASMNTLIVSGDKKDLDHIEQVVTDMDKQVSGAGAPRIVKL